MFQLHDKTRRRICLAGFFLFCALPVICAAVWCAARRSPWIARCEAKDLGALLGLEARISGLKNLRPGVVLFEDLQLADPETEQALLRCRLLLVRWKTMPDGHGGGKPMLELTASQPEIETAGFRQLESLLQRLMRGQIVRPACDLRFTAGELTLAAGANSQTIAAVDASLDNLPGGVQALAAFRLAGTNASEPVKIRLVRNRQALPPANGFELNTGGNELPCDMLAAFLPEMGELGSRSRFNGYIWANQESGGRTSDSWSGEVTGRLLDLDLDRLVSDHFSHKISGRADIVIHTARFNRGRLEQASGSVAAGPGVVGRSLLLAAARHLQLNAGVNIESLGEQVIYDRLAADLTLDARGLRIAGRCPSERIGTVMAAKDYCLLAAFESQCQPIAGFIRALAPDNAVLIPAAGQTDWLATHLAMPSESVPQTREAEAPASRVRLRQ
jgi:hypothetical protein